MANRLGWGKSPIRKTKPETNGGLALTYFSLRPSTFLEMKVLQTLSDPLNKPILSF